VDWHRNHGTWYLDTAKTGAALTRQLVLLDPVSVAEKHQMGDTVIEEPVE
jgi:hypothetical protein